MERLQADTKDLSCPGLVVVGGLESLDNQLPLGLAHGGPDTDANGISIICRGPHRSVAESWRQVLGLDHGPFADNHRAFQCVPQLTHVSRPSVISKSIEHGFADGGYAAGVFRVHF